MNVRSDLGGPARLLAVAGICSLILACGDDPSPAGQGGGATSSASSTSSGPGGAAGGGGAPTCPAGAHAGDDGCVADLVGWTAGPDLAQARDHHVTFVAETPTGAFLYAGFGAGSIAAAMKIERATIAEDGTLSAFTSTATAPKGLIGPGFAQDGRSFVVVGGLGTDSNSSTSTFVGTVADDGSLAFSPGPDLATSRYHVAAVLAKGYVFAIGGLNQDVTSGTPEQTVEATIERAAFDGKTLSKWETVAPLPGPLTHHAALALDDAIYVIGGGETVAATTDILRATVDDAGALGPWEVVGHLPEGRATSSAGVFLDQLYVFAGMSSLTGGEKATVLRAPLDPSGQVGDFAELAPLPVARAHSHQAPMHAGKIYSVAGSIKHAVQKAVFVGALE